VQSPAQQREDRAVVEDAMDQHDRRARCLDVTDEQSPLRGREFLD
jgi:hypothetical protein